MDFVHGTGGVVFDGTYQTYICMFSGGTMGTTASKLYCQVAVSSVFQTSGYLAFENAGKYNGSASASTYDVTAASLISTGCVYGTDTDAAFVGHIQFGDPSVVAEKKSAIFQTMTPFDNASNLRTFVGAGAFQTAGAIDGFRFIPSTGNFLTLRASLYGLTFA